jgi:RNA polymerase sigma-70 factor (ECF subfamily)
VTELDRLFRAEWGRLFAALVRALGDFDLAEEALQDAFAAAVAEWHSEPPQNARGWLYATARHKAIDRFRRRARFAEKVSELASLEPPEAHSFLEESALPDERLRLMFTCCHPALTTEAKVALTLRTLAGLSTEEIARAFLLPVPTMAQRLARAKAKIRDAAIPYVVPSEEELPNRLNAVMAVLYLVFNEGYSSATGELLSQCELCSEAIHLTRTLHALISPHPPEVSGLLALMLLQDARREARVDAHGELLLLADQDRSRWDREEIEEGCHLVKEALGLGPPGTYLLEAAIAAVHAEASTAEKTDWQQIAGLYERLNLIHPSPVVSLNRAVALAMTDGPEVALRLVDEIGNALANYHLWHATRADLLRRMGRSAAALEAYELAHKLAGNETERRFLARRIAEMRQSALRG